MSAELLDLDESIDLGIAPTAPSGKKRRFLFMRNAKALTGLGILGFFVVIAIIGEWIAPYDPDARSKDLLQPPSWDHLMGTTHTGQDVFSQVVLGTRSVLLIAFVAGFA